MVGRSTVRSGTQWTRMYLCELMDAWGRNDDAKKSRNGPSRAQSGTLIAKGVHY
jgi:hypothetical protein